MGNALDSPGFWGKNTTKQKIMQPVPNSPLMNKNSQCELVLVWAAELLLTVRWKWL